MHKMEDLKGYSPLGKNQENDEEDSSSDSDKDGQENVIQESEANIILGN